MATEFNFPRNATLYDKIDVPQLEQEIRRSIISASLDSAVESPTQNIRVIFRANLSQTEETVLSTIISQHTAVGLKPPASTIMIRPYQAEDRQMFVKGVKVEAIAGQDTKVDFQFPFEIELQGVEVETTDFVDGDNIEMFIVMPGNPETTLLQWGETVYVPPSKRIGFTAEISKPIPAGLIIRAVYRSTAPVGNPSVNMFMYLRCWR